MENLKKGACAMSKTPVVIFGNGQMAEIAHTYFAYDSPFNVVGFCVDKDFIDGDSFRALPQVAFEEIEQHFPPEEVSLFIPMSAKKINQIRAGKYNEAKKKGYKLVSYISPKATIFPEVEIGDNCFIFENNVIQPFAQIGNNCILWSGNHIGHHSKIMDHCFLASHVVISGRVTVEQFCYFGVNSTVRDGITIKERSILGAGALILRDTKVGKVYIQLPTKASPLSSDSANLV
jgi:sugar O-acyltransferase (sialic acid O-acetyltransferase NeuD family)